MQSKQAFLVGVFMATLALVDASSSIIISDSVIPCNASSTTSSTATSSVLDPIPTPSPNDNKSCSPCYCEGETWDGLGTWEEINGALQNSGIVRVTTIPHGYHVNENIAVNDHCLFFEIGVNKGDALNMTPQKITDLVSAARTKCAHGGRWNLNFVAADGDIQGKGWVKTDPQAKGDCS